MAIKDITVPQLGNALAAVSISGSTARSATLTTGVVRIQPTIDCFIKFGNSSVTAATTDHYLVGGGCYDLSYASATNVAIITSGASGTCYLSELV